MIRITLQGIDKINAYLKGVPQRVDREVANEMFMRGNATMTKAKRYTPVDTGLLRASGNVELPRGFGRRMTITLGFHTYYAIFVHEDLTAFHPVGGAKFLERAVNEDSRAFFAAMDRAVRRALKV